MMPFLVKNKLPSILTITIHTCQMIMNLTLAILNLTIIFLTLPQFIMSLTPPMTLKIHTDLPDMKNPPAHLKDCVCSSLRNQPTPSSSGIQYHYSYFHSFKSLSPNHESFSFSISLDHEPKTYEESCKDDNWLKYMDYELKALAINDT